MQQGWDNLKADIAPFIPTILDVSAFLVPLIIAITMHEMAHGWMAARFGDMTATRLGRVSLNPFRHIDRTGTIILPGLLILTGSPFLFGYARPVPVNFAELKPERTGMFFVAIAGVLLNLILAFLSALAIHIESVVTPEEAPWLFWVLYRSIAINIVLLLFNLIPILPLDGGRAVYALLPDGARRIYGVTERWGIWFILAVFLLPALSDHYLHTEYNIAETLIGAPAQFLSEWVLRLAGHGSKLGV